MRAAPAKLIRSELTPMRIHAPTTHSFTRQSTKAIAQKYTTDRLPRNDRRSAAAGLNDWPALKVEVGALLAPHCL